MASVRPMSLRASEARRIALAAQGFAGSASARKRRPFDQTLHHLHVLQIDSVNVFARSHYLPVFSRDGEYRTEALDHLLWSSGEYTEYWAHEAAFIPVLDRPLFAWRMRDFETKYAERAASLGKEIARVRSELAGSGPQFVRELERERRGTRGPWWDWSNTKRAVELLFATGEVMSVGRERFERRYALTQDVLPEAAQIDLSRTEAQLELIERAARSLGVATLPDLADYHRMRSGEAKQAARSLEEAGVLIPVEVEGWVGKTGAPLAAWLHRDALLPARLTPFDPITWYRPRAERIFDFHYRIEIYTPKERRQYGYYCLPLMIGGKLVGRVDLKADREGRRLLVQAAWQEPGAPAHTGEVASGLLTSAARWQGLESVHTTGTGNLNLPRARPVH